MLLDPEDLIASLGIGPLQCEGAMGRPTTGGDNPTAIDLRQREAALLAALGQGASLEQLCHRLRLSARVISQRLLALEVAGVVASAPGLWWRPC